MKRKPLNPTAVKTAEKIKIEKRSDYLVTPTSKRIADAIAAAIKEKGIAAKKFDYYVLWDKVSAPTVQRIRKGASGSSLRSYEQVLDALGLKLIVVPKEENEEENQ